MAFPTAVCNTIWAAGAARISDQIEKGASLRDAVANTLKECRNVIFTGNGYSSEWPEEAKKRGLSNLKTTPEAIKAFQGEKCTKALTSMKIFAKDECEAFAETMYENYATTLKVEAQTMINMVNSGFTPAMAKDLQNFTAAPELAGDRKAIYTAVVAEHAKLKDVFDKVPHELEAEATYLCNTVKPQMEALRRAVDTAEPLMGNYPYPTYEKLLYSHHF
jgi:glutamine synthetase